RGRRLNVPMHAVERILQRGVLVAAVAERSVIIESDEVGDGLELLFSRSTSRAITKARIVDSLVSQAGNGARIAADDDWAEAPDCDLIATDRSHAGSIGYGNCARAYCRYVGAIRHRQTTVVQHAAICAVSDRQTAVCGQV